METGKFDQLESFITRNRDGFDQHEPPAGLWDKVEDQLPKPKGKKVRLKLRTILTRAAAVAAIFVASFLLHHAIFPERHGDPTNHPVDETVLTEESVNPEVQELVEAEAYYSSQINGIRNELDQYLAEHPEIAREIKTEFNYLDSLYTDLKTDLNDNVSNQQVIEAMIQNQKVKLEILEQILNEMKRSESSVEPESDDDEEYEI